MALKVKAKKRKPLLQSAARLPKQERLISLEAHDARERAEWKKEKRVYWSSRFRRILAEIAEKPKAKKVSAL